MSPAPKGRSPLQTRAAQVRAPSGLAPTSPEVLPVLEPLAQASARQDLPELADHLRSLQAWLADDLQALEAGLQALLPAAAATPATAGGLPGERVRAAAAHLLALPGKRIRPLCVLLAARLGDRALDADLRRLAIACELVHTATLLHDDVIDGGEVRRGAPAARLIYGNAASILAGDFLLNEALRLVMAVPPPALLGSLLTVTRQMVAAEALQLERRGRFMPDRAVYLEVIRGKTAALFAWGLWAGGTLAALAPAALTALTLVGEALGTAFQLVDDVLDVDGDPAVTGKALLVDLREGKLTWPMIIAAERDPQLAAELRALAGAAEPNLSDARAAALLAAIRATGAIESTRAYAAEQAQVAERHIATLPPSPARAALGWVVAVASQRAH